MKRSRHFMVGGLLIFVALVLYGVSVRFGDSLALLCGSMLGVGTVWRGWGALKEEDHGRRFGENLASASGLVLCTMLVLFEGLRGAWWAKLWVVQLLGVILVVGPLGVLGVVDWQLWRHPLGMSPQLLSKKVSSWLTVVGVGVAGLGFHASVRQHDVMWDFSYTARSAPSGALLSLVQQRRGPELTLYLEADDARLPALRPYFGALQSNDGPKVRTVDQALVPELAREQRVTQNGILSITYRGKSLQIPLSARGALRGLDARILRGWRALTREKEQWLLLGGHGELEAQGKGAKVRRVVALAKTLERELGVELLPWSSLLEGPPAKATVLMVLGPTRRFSAQEVQALLGHMERGGTLWLSLEPDQPEVALSLAPVLARFGVSWESGVLCSKGAVLPLSKTIKDRENLILSEFGAHPVTRGVGQSRYGVLVRSAGRMKDLPVTRTEVTTTRTDILYSPPGTWVDLPHDYREKEPQSKRVIARVVEVRSRPGAKQRPVGRHVVTTDATMWSDFALELSQGNETLVVALGGWVLGEEERVERLDRPRDVRILHRQDEELWIFWITTLAPSLVLGGLGGLLWWRRRRGGQV